MMYIKGQQRDQMMLAYCLDDLIAQDSPVRVIDAFIDQLDLASMGFSHTQTRVTGRPAYDPAVLLKLYVYGYFNRIRSSRRLMVECRRNVELFFLLGQLTPDFRTIADFRKDNAAAIRQVFRSFVSLCLSFDLYSKELVAVDGSKFRAVNSRKKMFNQEILEKKLARIEDQAAAYFRELDEQDRLENEEDANASLRKQLQTKLAALARKKDKYQAMLSELKESGETQLLTTDPQARMMQSKDGFHCCYNVQTAVDSGSHLIAGFRVTNRPNDQQVLSDFASEVKQDLKAPMLPVVADKGYDSKEEILACIQNGILPYVGFRYDKEERLCVLDYDPKPVSDALLRSTEPEALRTCLQAGVLPACYEGTNLSIEIREERAVGCFHRTPGERSVICPMGHRLNRIREKNGGTEYACKPVCRQCTNRCTPSKNHRVVRFGPGTEYVATRMYGEEEPLLRQPPGFVPHNSFFRKNAPGTTVLLRIADDVPKQRLRLCLSEHPFGTVKWSHGAHYLLCKGIEKASAELGLSFLSYNLRRVINLMGASALLRAIKEA